MDEVLGPVLAERLRQGFRDFGRKIPGYATNAAQIVGVESRTSAPIRIPRDKDTLQHPVVTGLFPCGEGARATRAASCRAPPWTASAAPRQWRRWYAGSNWSLVAGR